jgi:hypothetical protein
VNGGSGSKKKYFEQAWNRSTPDRNYLTWLFSSAISIDPIILKTS